MDTFPHIIFDLDGWSYSSDSDEAEWKEKSLDTSAQTRCADMTSADLEKSEKSTNEANTVRQTAWALNCLQTWLNLKAIQVNFQLVEKTELNKVLRDFYGSIRTTKGELYSISSYIGLRAGLNRYFSEPLDSRSWNLIQDTEFIPANKVFKAMVKKIRTEGKNRATHYSPISPEDQHILKYSAALSPDNPKGLLNKVWYDIQLHFGRRGKEGNRDLKPNSFILQCDDSGAKYFTMTFNEERKSHKDPLERARANRRGAMYEERGKALCPVASLEKYLQKIPPDAKALYLQPRRVIEATDNFWYTGVPLGVNLLSQMLPRICKEAGTSMSYTNHSLRATAIQKLSDAGLEERGIMAVSGHRMKKLNPPSASLEATELKTKSRVRKLIKQEIHRAMEKKETKLQDLIKNVQQLNEVNLENSIQKLEDRINTISRRAEVALSYIRKTQQKSPCPPLGNVDVIRGNPENHTMDAAEEKSDEKITDCGATSGKLFKMMENTQHALKRIHMDKEALKAVMADTSPEMPPPILSPEGSLEKMDTSAMPMKIEQSPPVLLPNGCSEWMEQKPIKKEPEDYQDAIEDNYNFKQFEPKAKRLKEEILSPEPDICSPKHKDEEWLYYPPLPTLSFPSALSMEAASYIIPKKLELNLAFIKNPTMLSVMWDVKEKDPCDPPMESYTIYLTMEKVKGTGIFPNWYTYDKLEAKALPMCALIKKYKPGHKVCAAVVGKDVFGRYGPYSDVFTAIIPD